MSALRRFNLLVGALCAFTAGICFASGSFVLGAGNVLFAVANLACVSR